MLEFAITSSNNTGMDDKTLTATATVSEVFAQADDQPTNGKPRGLEGARITTENFALDSFENVVFSTARFREYTGRYPSRLTVISYGMKQKGFHQLHAKAIRWPIEGLHNGERQFSYIGIDDQCDTTAPYEGEKMNGFELFEKDLYGSHGTLQASV